MIYIYKLFLFSIFIPLSHASDLPSCLETAQFYGHHQAPQVLAQECQNLILNEANIFQKIATSDSKYQIYGHKNLAFVDEYQDISGVQTLISSTPLAGDQTKIN